MQCDSFNNLMSFYFNLHLYYFSFRLREHLMYSLIVIIKLPIKLVLSKLIQ